MSTSVFDFPTSLELERVEQKLLPSLTQDCPFFRWFPFVGKQEWDLRWVQKDNYSGLQQFRGLGGKPGRVSMKGDKEYIASPGAYGEFIALDEREITMRRNAATLSGGPIGITELVSDAQMQLLNRRIKRQAYILSQLIVNGVFSVSDSVTNAVLHTDSFTQQTITASAVWTDYANATPLQDLRQLPIKVRGQSVSMGPDATILMNYRTASWLLNNNNANDLGGKKLNYGQTANLNMKDINNILLGEGLPQIEIYEGGYEDDSGTFQLFIPDGKAVAIGRRTSGTPLGEYRYTMNRLAAGGAAKPYTLVIDQQAHGHVPGAVEVHDGHNGGPVIFFPGAIVSITNLSA